MTTLTADKASWYAAACQKTLALFSKYFNMIVRIQKSITCRFRRAVNVDMQCYVGIPPLPASCHSVLFQADFSSAL